MKHTEHFTFEDAEFKVYEVLEDGIVRYRYRGRSEGVHSYKCPHTFETRELAVFAAKLTAIWWNMDTLMLPACVEDLRNHELLLVNPVGKYFFGAKPGQHSYEFTANLESYCEFYRDLKREKKIERKQMVYADGTLVEGVVSAHILEVPQTLVIAKFR